VKYWIHNNMITIDGQKMSKSLGNFITLEELFAGSHKLLSQAFEPGTVRFFILQAHYRGTLDFSNTALEAAEKGLNKLLNGIILAKKIATADNSTSNIAKLREECIKAISDDFNTPVLISHLFEAVRITNSVNAGEESISKDDLKSLNSIFEDFAVDILGLSKNQNQQGDNLMDPLMDLILDIRQESRANKDFATSDKIRDVLSKLNITTKDEDGGTSWSYEG